MEEALKIDLLLT